MGQGGLELEENFEWKTIFCLDRALHQVQNSEQTLEIKLYHREIRRFERLYPEIDIIKGNRFNTTDLWECTIIKRK